jgi:ABC-2 type transport system ATP-binding protein
MSNIVISLNNVNKIFKVPEEVKGKFNKFKNFIIKKQKDKKVITNMSFEITEGEKIGYIGENGSGKSTTIKMLTGILIPTSGEIKCLGKNPFTERTEYVKDIGVVFGNRSLLNQDIPPRYSLEIQGAIYNLEDKYVKDRINEFAKELDVTHLLNTQVRKLSLGERMRFEIIASLLHNPKIVFLDEPTIGLDLIAREKIIKFLDTINKKYNTTIILTTHNMDDIEELCNRIIMIDEGKKVYDGDLKELKNKYANWKIITIYYKKELKEPNLKNLEIIEKNNNYIILKAPAIRIDLITKELLSTYEVIDLKIEEPNLKEIVKKIYVDGYVK